MFIKIYQRMYSIYNDVRIYTYPICLRLRPDCVPNVHETGDIALVERPPAVAIYEKTI